MLSQKRTRRARIRRIVQKWQGRPMIGQRREEPFSRELAEFLQEMHRPVPAGRGLVGFSRWPGGFEIRIGRWDAASG
jgi:hypothetical protein